MTDRHMLLRWSLANAVGMALGFLLFLEVLMFLAFGPDVGRHWSTEAVERWAAENRAEAERLLRIGLAIGLPLAGAVLAGGQA